MADAADVDEVLSTGLDPELRVSAAAHDAVADKSHRDVRVAEKTDRRVLVGKARGGGESVKDVTPPLRPIQRGVNDRKAGHQPDVFKLLEPLPIVPGQLRTRPLDCFRRMRVEPVQIRLAGTILVVVSFHTRHPHVPDDIEAFLRIGVVADDVAKAGVMGAVLFFCVVQHHPQRLQIGVDVSYDGVLHVYL